MKPSMMAVMPICLLVMRGLSSAAPPDPEAAGRAERLFQDGHVLLKQGRFDESCASFAASQREEPASGTLLALAYCEERAGRLTTAWQEYGRAGELAATENQADRQAAAKERATALFPRLSTLTINVPQPAPDDTHMVVRSDGRKLERSLWGTPMPIDGGRHVVEASATGRKAWTFIVTVRNEGDHQTVTVAELQPDGTSPPQFTIAAPSSEAKPARAPAPEVRDEGRSTRTLRGVGWGLAIASAAGFGLGTVFAIVASSKNNQSNANGHCDARGCDEIGMDLRNDALSTARLATVSVIAGGLLGASSVTVFLLADTGATSASGSAWSPGQPLRISGVGLSGKF